MNRYATALAVVVGLTVAVPVDFHPETTPTCSLSFLYNSYGKPFGGKSFCTGTFWKQYVKVGCGNGTIQLAVVTGPLANPGETSRAYCPWYAPRAHWVSRALYT